MKSGDFLSRKLIFALISHKHLFTDLVAHVKINRRVRPPMDPSAACREPLQQECLSIFEVINGDVVPLSPSATLILRSNPHMPT